MKIISHSADADGRLSAFLIADKFNITNENDIIMTDYGKHDDIFSKIEKGEKVFVCDFSFENGPDDMKKLQEITNDIVWLDHHISSINKYGDYGKDIPGLRVDGIAACMLTYIYFYILESKENNYNNDEITKEVCEDLSEMAPRLVRYVHDNDVWRYKYGENTAFFKLALDSAGITSPLDPKWKIMMYDNTVIEKMLSDGKILSGYRDSLSKYACDTIGFEYEIDGKIGFCVNIPFGGSQWFLDKIKEYDFVCSFSYDHNTKEWKYSFYADKSKDTECYKLAQSINPKGGGHKGAAGCVDKKFIFE